jgi:hypothetical protein
MFRLEPSVAVEVQYHELVVGRLSVPVLRRILAT